MLNEINLSFIINKWMSGGEMEDKSISPEMAEPGSELKIKRLA